MFSLHGGNYHKAIGPVSSVLWYRTFYMVSLGSKLESHEMSTKLRVGLTWTVLIIGENLEESQPSEYRVKVAETH